MVSDPRFLKFVRVLFLLMIGIVNQGVDIGTPVVFWNLDDIWRLMNVNGLNQIVPDVFALVSGHRNS
jgi:hypothetical protein